MHALFNKNRMTVVYPFYNHHEIFKHHLDTWSHYDTALRARIEFIVVDDCSKKPLEISGEYPIDLSVYRVTDHIYWNYGAKNLGIRKSKYDWFLLSELDHLIPEKAARRILTLRRSPDIYFMFRRRNTAKEAKDCYSRSCHPATFYMSRELFEKVGGIDEDFSGEYGYDDIFFRECLQHLGARVKVPRWITLTNYSGNHQFSDADLWYDTSIPRDLSRNKEILKKKRETMEVNRDQIRFRWEKVYPEETKEPRDRF